MNTEFPRTTWARATREHDDEFRRALVAEIITAIAKASMVTTPTSWRSEPARRSKR
jgi:hypothetical protein